MGVTKILFAVIVTLVLATALADSGRCPPRSHVYNRTPVCRQDYDCSHGKVCCPNSLNTKSCTGPVGLKQPDHKPIGGPGVYCDGVKCRPFEVCKMDPQTRRLKCVRA